jgi:hypothetical protein
VLLRFEVDLETAFAGAFVVGDAEGIGVADGDTDGDGDADGVVVGGVDGGVVGGGVELLSAIVVSPQSAALKALMGAAPVTPTVTPVELNEVRDGPSRSK